MNYYIKETLADPSQIFTAGSKARDDVETIFSEKDFTPILLEVMQNGRKEQKSLIQKLNIHREIYQEWMTKTENLLCGDTLFIQFPCLEHTLFLKRVLVDLKRRQVKVVLLIHDLEMLRISKEKNTKMKKKIRLRIEEYSCLKIADIVIAHNKKMAEYLMKSGIEKSKIVTLEIFDYLIPTLESVKNRDRNKVIIAGNLAEGKAGYIYNLPEYVKFELYGVNYTGIQNDFITYHGSYPPDELPNVMEGGFGLVWDGISSETCAGVWGEYLKINNPHKTSLYLASGIPVLIWKEAALADFVVKNHCGILIGALEEIPEVLNRLSQEEYDDLKMGAQSIGDQLRNGCFTEKAIIRCINRKENTK